jgi:hypothetical protein
MAMMIRNAVAPLLTILVNSAVRPDRDQFDQAGRGTRQEDARHHRDDCAEATAANAFLLDDLICASKNEIRNGKP